MKFRDTVRVIGVDKQGVNFERWFRHHEDTGKTELYIWNKDTGETTIKDIDHANAFDGSQVVEDLLHEALRKKTRK